MMFRNAPRRGGRTVAAICSAAAMLLTGCGFTGIYDIPLPGGADVGANPIEMKIHFRDVLDLVPQTHVKINEVAVGRVEEINLAKDSWNAEVTILLNRNTNMPGNALANIKMSSLLGEKYVELVHPPEGSARGKLDNGSVIPVSRTNRNVEIEEVLGALSMLLNGGGVEQLNTITKELNNVYQGAGGTRELKAVLHNSNTLVKGLDGQTSSIDRALNGLNRLSKVLREDKEIVAKALDDLSPGMKVLIEQRKDLVRSFESLSKLSEVATDVMNKSKGDFIDNLESLRPILKHLADSGSDLPKSLELLVSFPFADSAVDIVKGDYANLFARIDLDIQAIIDNFRRNKGHPTPGLPILKELPMEEGEPLDPNQVLPHLPFANPNLPAGSPSLDGSGAGQLIEGLTGGGR